MPLQIIMVKSDTIPFKRKKKKISNKFLELLLFLKAGQPVRGQVPELYPSKGKHKMARIPILPGIN